MRESNYVGTAAAVVNELRHSQSELRRYEFLPVNFG